MKSVFPENLSLCYYLAMCGLIGVYGHKYITQDVYDGLVTLQHRGQDATGIITYDGAFHVRKDFGMVKDVFHTRHMRRLQGYAGIGHTRYATIGTGDIEEVQPFMGPSPFGVMLAHNGNLFNSAELKKEIFEKDHRLVNSDSDGEVLLNLFTKELSKQNPPALLPLHVWQAVESVYKRARGAYSVVSYVAGQGMIGFRDPHGIRPLILGKRDDAKGATYMFASESVTLEILGFTPLPNIEAGEAVFIDETTRTVHRKKIVAVTATPCAFEYIYFARPDSVIDGISVYAARLKMGEALALKIKEANIDIDVVMPVPDSGRTASFMVADVLGVPYREGLIKNRYIGRTFIMPENEGRKRSVRFKLNPVESEIKGKSILLVDDSIVRGNTSRQIIELMKNIGARKVYFASYAPAVIHPNVYGIDIPTRTELIAVQKTTEEVCAELGADGLFYGTTEDLLHACLSSGTGTITDLDMSCFDGIYKTGDVTSEILARQELTRTNERLAPKIY